MEENNKEIVLSVIDVERKYSVPDYEETAWNSEQQMVSYGKENTTPILFRNCYRNSATLHSIIDSYVSYIAGDNVVVSEKIALFEKKVNRKNMTMRQLVKALALSKMIYNGFAIEIIRNKLGAIVELYPLDFIKCRTNASGSKIWYNKKGFTKYSRSGDEFPAFNPEKPEEHTIFYWKGDYTRSVYPLPLWYGALKDVLTEISASEYSLNSIGSGFSGRYIISLPNASNLPKEQKDLIQREIREKFTGADAEQNFMLYFSNGVSGVTVSRIEADDVPERYTAIKDNCRSNIFTALRTSPMLCGLYQNSGFSTDEYRDSFKLFQRTVIAPIQDEFVEVFDTIFAKAIEGSGKHAITITPFIIEFDD